MRLVTPVFESSGNYSIVIEIYSVPSQVFYKASLMIMKLSNNIYPFSTFAFLFVFPAL